MNHATCSFLVLAGLAGAWYAVCGRGHFAAIAERRAAMADAYARFERAELAADEIGLLEQADAELEAWREELAIGGTGEAPAPLLLAAANDVKACGLAVEGVEAMPADQGLGPNQRVRLAVSGTFANLFRALVAIENSTLPTRVTELNVHAAADSDKVRSELVVVRRWLEAR
ncbi:MAG: hypothetical protein WAT39_20770 [Planctomycetota bacterium]